LERTDLRKLNDEYINQNNDINTELSRLKERVPNYKNKINNLSLTNDVYLTTLEEASELLAEYKSKHGDIKKDRTLENITNKVSGPIMSIEQIVDIINKQHEVYKT
jgi:topoisomerase IA-like protein